MSNFLSIKISDFIGIFNTIAQKANINGGDTLEGEEINIFYDAQNSIKKIDKNKSIFSIGDKTYDSNGEEFTLPPYKPSEKKYNPKPDFNKEENFFNYKELDKEKENQLIKNENALKSVKQYVIVKEYVLDQMKKHNIKFDKIKDAEYKKELLDKAEYITKIVCEKCEKYDISDLSTVVAQILGMESGGYNITDGVMKNDGSQYKGMMQTSLEICCAIFATGTTSKVDIGNKKKLGSSKSDAIYKNSYENHYSQDEERIQGLKEKYKTPEALYKAIQENVELSLEVGILAFKAKLSVAEGNVKKAVGMYCGKQYVVNLNNAPEIFEF